MNANQVSYTYIYVRQHLCTHLYTIIYKYTILCLLGRNPEIRLLFCKSLPEIPSTSRQSMLFPLMFIHQPEGHCSYFCQCIQM